MKFQNQKNKYIIQKIVKLQNLLDKKFVNVILPKLVRELEKFFRSMFSFQNIKKIPKYI